MKAPLHPLRPLPRFAQYVPWLMRLWPRNGCRSFSCGGHLLALRCCADHSFVKAACLCEHELSREVHAGIIFDPIRSRRTARYTSPGRWKSRCARRRVLASGPWLPWASGRGWMMTLESAGNIFGTCSMAVWLKATCFMPHPSRRPGHGWIPRVRAWSG